MSPHPHPTPPILLFGYASSPFTQKIRLALRLKNLPYTYIAVPSMLPRPLLTQTFGLSYRKIPVLALGRDVYCDTALIVEALEHFFPPSAGFATVYPSTPSGYAYAPMARLLSTFWTDRPLFRATTGLIPGSVWRSAFGDDRAGLIGHALDPEKLAGKVGRNLGVLDAFLSVLEPLFAAADGAVGAGDGGGGGGGGGGGDGGSGWLFPTPTPSLADLSLFYQLDWGNEIAAGRGVGDLTGGAVADSEAEGEGAGAVFSEARYPGLLVWFGRFRRYVEALPVVEMVAAEADVAGVLEGLKRCEEVGLETVMVSTGARAHGMLDRRNGLVVGTLVSVAPEDTGRDSPTTGTLLGLTPEEVVMKPAALETKPLMDVRIHFPRLGFVVKPLSMPRL